MEPVAAPDSCYAGVLPDPTGSDLEEIRELRSSKLDGKDLPQVEPQSPLETFLIRLIIGKYIVI